MTKGKDAALNTVEFIVGADDLGRATISPLVDGTALAVLVDRFERLKGFEPSGSYFGIVPRSFRLGSLGAYFMGRPESEYLRHRGCIVLLGCKCGELGCRPLEAKAVEVGKRVRWSGFRPPHRKQLDYTAFGPFEFDVAQYGDALRKLLADRRLGDEKDRLGREQG